VTAKVTVTRNGKKEKVPFPIAHIERLKERAAKGDPKADQALFQIYRALGIFNSASPSSDEPYVFTLNLGKIKNDVIIDDDDKFDSSSDDKAHDPNKPDDIED
jgi:hypothetical protein